MNTATPSEKIGAVSTVDAKRGAAEASPCSAGVLTHLLRRAAHAHHFHELALGGPHEDWPTWYAAHMANTLADHGYQLTLTPGRDGLDLSGDPTAGVAAEAKANEARIAP